MNIFLVQELRKGILLNIPFIIGSGNNLKIGVYKAVQTLRQVYLEN